MAVNMKYWRIWLLIYNILLALIAFAAICLSFYLLYHVLKYKQFIEDKGIIALSIIIVSGCLSIVFAWVGWKVVRKSSVVQVILFGVLMLVLVVGNLICFFIIMSLLHKLKDVATIRIEESFKAAILDESNRDLKLWTDVQSQLMCCGVGGPTDYRASKSVPWSCCKRSFSGSEMDDVGDCSAVYQKGCLISIYDKTFDHMLNFAFISLALALIQLLGSACYFYMAKLMRKKAAAEIQLPPTENSQETRRGLLSRPQKY